MAYAAFRYLGGVTPGCCDDLVNKYWTEWTVYLTTNTQDQNPIIQWFTDDPTRLQIVATGTAGAQLFSLGHSAPGTNFDIHIWVTVDGVQSAQFPVFINAPWQQSQTDPSPFDSNGNMLTCAGNINAQFPNGWVGQTTNQITDLTGALLIPIDVRETFENDQPLFNARPARSTGGLIWRTGGFHQRVLGLYPLGKTIRSSIPSRCVGLGPFQRRQRSRGEAAIPRRLTVTRRSTGWVRPPGLMANALSDRKAFRMMITSPSSTLRHPSRLLTRPRARRANSRIEGEYP